MATTDSTPKTFHILYGWAEGPWHGRKLSQALQCAGYTQASIDKANLVITHSAGGFQIPASIKASEILIIGLPYWPHKFLATRGVRKIWHDFLSHRNSLIYWLLKTGWNIIYLVRRPVYNLQLIRVTKRKDCLSYIPTPAVIVRNQHDDFCTPHITQHVNNHIITLPGQHDDCWRNPTPYINLINQQCRL